MDENVVIVPYRDGPYVVRGPAVLADQDGGAIDAGRRTVALCRCGKSRTRPFCDGTHQLLGFRAASGAQLDASDEQPCPPPPAAVGAAAGGTVRLPPARGPWTEALLALFAGERAPSQPAPPDDPLRDDDFQLALYLAYELHYSGLAGVDDRFEWDPGVLGLRAAAETVFESGVRELVGFPSERPASVGEAIQRLVQEDDGPSLSRFVEQRATLEQLLEHVVHRSAYQLKEADPHSWAIPRLRGGPKAALVEIQADEYGGGRPERMHSALFANTMSELGLDASYGAYVDRLPGITLATVNLMSLFGLHRRLRGALTGHLAVFEMTSSVPNRRYGNGLRRLGLGPAATGFYDEHVVADAVHESIAAWDLADGLARSEPQLATDIIFGGRALLALEALWAEHLLNSWSRGETSLLRQL